MCTKILIRTGLASVTTRSFYILHYSCRHSHTPFLLAVATAFHHHPYNKFVCTTIIYVSFTNQILTTRILSEFNYKIFNIIQSSPAATRWKSTIVNCIIIVTQRYLPATPSEDEIFPVACFSEKPGYRQLGCGRVVCLHSWTMLF